MLVTLAAVAAAVPASPTMLLLPSMVAYLVEVPEPKLAHGPMMPLTKEPADKPVMVVVTVPVLSTLSVDPALRVKVPVFRARAMLAATLKD